MRVQLDKIEENGIRFIDKFKIVNKSKDGVKIKNLKTGNEMGALLSYHDLKKMFFQIGDNEFLITPKPETIEKANSPEVTEITKKMNDLFSQLLMATCMTQGTANPLAGYSMTGSIVEEISKLTGMTSAEVITEHMARMRNFTRSARGLGVTFGEGYEKPGMMDPRTKTSNQSARNRQNPEYPYQCNCGKVFISKDNHPKCPWCGRYIDNIPKTNRICNQCGEKFTTGMDYKLCPDCHNKEYDKDRNPGNGVFTDDMGNPEDPLMHMNDNEVSAIIDHSPQEEKARQEIVKEMETIIPTYESGCTIADIMKAKERMKNERETKSKKGKGNRGN